MNKITERTSKKMNKDRRQFLESLGRWGVSSALFRASPIVGAFMQARFAQAQTTNDKKMILIYHPNGSPDGRYLDLNGGLSFDAPAISPLKPHSANVAALEMTISKPGNHGNLWLAAGAESYNGSDANSSSVNIQAAKVLGNLTPFRSIQLGVYSGQAGSSLPQGDGSQAAGIDRLNGQPIAREWNSSLALQSIFNSAPPVPPATGGGGVLTGPSLFAKRLEIYEANLRALDQLETKLDGDERDKLLTHRAAVQRLQARATLQQEEYLQELADANNGGSTSSSGGSNGGCTAPNISPFGTALNEYKAQADIAIAALSCGLTNVVSIQFNETQASWIPNDGSADAVAVTAGADHHAANHGNDNSMLPQIIQYMNKGAAHVISGLKTAGIFNQTAVCIFSEMGDGQNHTAGNGPITLASGISGFSGTIRKTGVDHYGIYADLFTLLGLDSAVGGGMIHNYGNGVLL
jgi:hypothetical protein